MHPERRGTTRTRRRARAASAALVVVLALVVVGCVGRYGRNDDRVEPGSEGRPRTEIPVRVERPMPDR